MKKMLLSSMLTIAFSSILIAQQKEITPQVQHKPIPRQDQSQPTAPQVQPVTPGIRPAPSETLSLIYDITVYEQPGYQGRSGYFMMRGDRLESPFPVSNVSFTVPAGKIVYIKRCDGFASESAYAASQTSIDLTSICGIRSDVLTTLTVQFNGISTIIHSDDCKRIFGDIKIKILENAPGASGGSLLSEMILSTTTFMGGDSYTFLPFANENASSTPRYGYGYRDYVRNEIGLRPSGFLPVVNSPTVGNAAGVFKVGRNALRDGRLKIVVISNLGSAHKNCNSCLDFSSNVRMRAPITETLPINHSDGRVIDATHNRLILGSYEASGLPDHSPAASGGVFQNFRVHLSLVGL